MSDGKECAMQVILLEKIVNLGGLGDVVKVRDGFARNYLIPQGKAKRATRANVAEFERRRSELEQAQADTFTRAQEKAAKLDGLMVQVTQKAGVDGKLFGSVTNVDVSEALKAQGFDVPKAAIRMPQGPLKTVGDHPLKIALHADVVVTVTVSVLGEQ
jgi:large subunit ribosomal protein L9